MANHLNDNAVLFVNLKHPEIYVVCKATYQTGNIHGIWIDVTQPMQDILKRIALMKHESCNGGAEMLSEGYCPDPSTYFIHCHMGFYNVEIQGNAKIEDVRSYALFIAQYGELGAELISLQNGNLEKAKQFMDECYLGAYESQAAYAEELFNQHYLPRILADLQFCINYKHVKEAIFMRQGFSIEVSGRAHVFKYLKKNLIAEVCK